MKIMKSIFAIIITAVKSRKCLEEATIFCLSEGSENMILHIMNSSTWEERKNKEFWGKRNIDAEGFIHCSQPEYFWRVAPNFDGTTEEFIILCIDETKLFAKVKYEDGDNCGRSYPHVYGMINNSAVTAVLPFLRGENGKLVKNQELEIFEDK